MGIVGKVPRKTGSIMIIPKERLLAVKVKLIAPLMGSVEILTPQEHAHMRHHANTNMHAFFLTVGNPTLTLNIHRWETNRAPRSHS